MGREGIVQHDVPMLIQARRRTERASKCPRASSLGLAGVCGLLASCGQGVLDPHGPVGQAERIILSDATAIMLAVVGPVIALTLIFAWWFRAGNKRAKYRPDWEYSGRIEMIIWSIPALVILFLGGIAWIGSHELDPPRPLSAHQALEVEVIALDWRWLFIYPEHGIASLNRLAVPTGVPIHFKLTSTSVMNSFFIPQLGSQIYCMPGMTTQLNLQADDAATYQGLSAQYSGDGFSDMRFTVEATSPEEFQQWIDRTRSQDGALNLSTFVQLAKPAHAGAPATYSRVDPELFQEVSTGKLATRWSPEEAR
jgi:cytochrome o ubiquinol oxidase subunit 2